MPVVSANTQPSTAQQSTPRSTAESYNDGEWTYPCLVVDPDAVYLPDGTVLTIDEEHVATFADIADLADSLGIGHHAAPGQLWLTQRTTDHMGLVIRDDDQLPDPNEQKKFAKAVNTLLTERGAHVLVDNGSGWRLGDDQAESVELRPRVRMVRRDGRVFTLVLAHYATLWDPRRTGPDHHRHPLPEPTEDARGYGVELARRAARLTEVLGQPWASSAGQMGATIADRVRGRSRDRVTEAGLIPDLGENSQNQLEPTWSWWRTFSSSSVEALLTTPYVHRFDARASWLLCAGTLNLGYGQPSHYAADEAAQAASRDKLPFGLWRVTLPTWEHATLMPPHPAIPHSNGAAVTCWVTTPSLRLLATADHLDLEVPIHEAWIWPKEGRKLSRWYETVRDALQDARGRAHDSATTADAATWEAVAESIKNVYSGYIGRMISPATRHSQRPWHHQPVWQAAIVAEARRRDYVKLLRQFEASGVAPVAAVGTDEYWVLSDRAEPDSVAPDEDNGKLGKLRPKGEPLVITDELAHTICGVSPDALPRQATPIHRVLGGER